MVTPTLEQKVQMYEALLHDLQMYAAVVMNGEKVGALIQNICDWSYAHRQGNGELSVEEQQALVDHAFWKLRNLKS